MTARENKKRKRRATRRLEVWRVWPWDQVRVTVAGIDLKMQTIKVDTHWVEPKRVRFNHEAV